VYEEILSHFHENDDMTASEVRRNLSNVALVCRYFSSFALPRIFAEMNLSGGCQDSSTNRFCRALANNQQPAVSLARYIKTCNLALFMLPITASLNQSQNAFLSMYCVALGKMTSVDAIDLHCVTIDKRLIKAMKKLPFLRSLRLSQCQVGETEAEAFKSLISTLRLETLAVLPEDDWIFHFSFPSCDFNFRHLKNLEVDDWSIIQHLARHEDVFKIESLTIHMVLDPQILTDVFSRMPDITQLHIYRMKLAEQIVFPNSILPKLSFFDGPPALAHSLVQSRPIKRVWLSGSLYESVERSSPELPPLGHDIWTVLRRSTASIREIIIPRHLYDVASLHRHLPSVSILKICWCLGNWAYNNNIIQSEEDLISVSSKHLDFTRFTDGPYRKLKHSVTNGRPTHPLVKSFSNLALAQMKIIHIMTSYYSTRCFAKISHPSFQTSSKSTSLALLIGDGHPQIRFGGLTSRKRSGDTFIQQW
jgi:hypothetical protein